MNRMVLEPIVSTLSVMATVVASAAALAYWLGRRFAQVEAELGRMGSELKGLRAWAEGEFKDLRTWTEGELKDLRAWAEGEFKGLRAWAEGEFKNFRAWAEGEFKDLRTWAEGEFKGLRAWAEGRFNRIEGSVEALSMASAEAHRVVVDFLALKGLVERAESDYLARRVEGVFRVHAQHSSTDSPLSEEELRFLAEFFSRAAKNVDELTVDEAERAYELGKRLFVKGHDGRGFMAAMAAAYVRGYLVSREVRKRRSEAQP